VLSGSGDGTVEVTKPEQAQPADDEALAEGRDAKSQVRNNAAANRGFDEIKCAHN